MKIQDARTPVQSNFQSDVVHHHALRHVTSARHKAMATDAETPPSPSLTLILGPAGAGKTEWALRRFVHCRETGEHALLVVSSPQQAQTRAEQLAERLGCAPADVLGSLRTFRQLASDLAAENEEREAYRAIGRPFQRLALSTLFPENIRDGDFLGRMLRAPGFVPALAERLREWKLACLTPDLLEQCGPPLADELADPTFPYKTRELARLFRAYETFLTRNRLRDDEDGLRFAVERVHAQSTPLPWNVSCILVDGFYRFNPMQRLLLAALAERDCPPREAMPGEPGKSDRESDKKVEVIVTLPYESRRPLLFAAPSRTLSLLRQEFACREIALTHSSPSRPPALALLSDALFDSNAAEETGRKEEKEKRRKEEGQEQDVSSSFTLPPSSLSLFDAPNPYVEAEMVGREFRRLYDAGGYAWSDFAVILRAMGDYAPILAAVFERHGIPLGVDGPEILAENPLLKTLLHLLAVVRHGWKRDDVLAFLKSSYTAPDKLQADALSRRARKAGIREGRERWLPLAEETGRKEEKEKRRKEEGQEQDVSSSLSVAATLNDMAHYDALLTRERQDPRRFAELIEESVTFFGLADRIAQGEPTRQERDRAAWQAAQEVLQALAQMTALSGRSLMTFDAFYDELLIAWQSASSTAVAEGDMVRVAEPYDARERPLKVAAVMGLTERVFPRRITEDPFLRDEERVAMSRWANVDLEEQKGRADDERFFFYLAVTAPAERLILSYPRSADESDTLPSFYLDEVRTLFAPIPQHLNVVSRTLADVAPRPEEVVSDADRLLAACAGLFDPGASLAANDAESLAASVSLMQTCLQGEEKRRITQRVVESRGLPRLPRLQSDRLRRAFAAHRTVFSVSELESYGRCPFQYFLRHVLRLHPEEDGAHVRAQGTLLHNVLHRYFAGKGKGKREKGKEERQDTGSFSIMREDLQAILTEMLAQESLDTSPHQMRMMHRLLSDALDGFVAREQRFTEQFGMTPAHFELSFGLQSRVGAGGESEDAWEDEERAFSRDAPQNALRAEETKDASNFYDAASCAEPLLLNVTDGGSPVAICGTLDRVDLDASGRRALILDYKLGRPPDFSEIQRGQSLQMPLYLLAVERLFDKVGAVACYDSMRERGRRRFHRSEHVNQRQFMPVLPLEDGTTVTPLNRGQYTDLLKTAEATAVRLARAIVDGSIEATPGDHCRRCAYKDVCRTTVLGGHDGETLPLMP